MTDAFCGDAKPVILPRAGIMTRISDQLPRFPLAALAALGMAVSGCAGSKTDYPSFAIPTPSADGDRFAMRFPGANVPQAADPGDLAAPLPEDLDGRIGAITARADAARADFVTTLITTRRRVDGARGAGVTSDRWAEAEVSLANLTSLHNNATLALADLDLLAAQAATALASADRIAAIAAAQARIAKVVEEQDQQLATLGSELAR